MNTPKTKKNFPVIKFVQPSASLLRELAPITPLTDCPQISVHQAPDVFALWQAWENESKTVCDVPYWAIVWPAAQVLARYIFENPKIVKGKTVLDCGCGGGAAAISAAMNGAEYVAGCDLDETAVLIAKINATVNTVSVDFFCKDIIESITAHSYDVILVADMFYQKDFSSELMKVLKNAQVNGSDVIIADSGRPFLPKDELIEIYYREAKTSFDVEGCCERTVRLYTF